MQVLDNFIGGMRHGNFVAFPQPEPIIAAHPCEFLDLLLHDLPNFGAITCACLQNDRRLGFLACTVQKHFVRANLNKLCGLIALPHELRARTYGEKEG